MKPDKNKSKKNIKAVLFDLGKVIVDFDFEPAFRKLAKFTPQSAAAIEDYFWSSGVEVLYDGGKISSLDFHREVKRALKHTLSYREFKNIWNDIFTPKKEIVTLIKRLSRDRRLVLLSNTNAMHYAYLRKKYSVLNHFDRCILSFKEKIRKPDKKIYQAAAKACLAKPGEIFYIDDRADLTDAANTLGFNTFTFKNNSQALITTMKDFGILR